MPASIERVSCEWVGVLRCGPNHYSWEDGDDYSVSATVCVKDGIAKIEGLSGNASISDFREILIALKKEGVKEIIYDRIKDDDSVRFARIIVDNVMK